MEVYGKAFATIQDVEEKDYGPYGGFTAVLSTPSEDRDGDELYREEWKDFTQERYPLDMDHGMSVAETIGSFVPYFDGQKMMMEARFAKHAEAQKVRDLVTPDEDGIRHIQSVSVAFMVDKTKKSGTPKRELLGAGVVSIPSNRDSVILAGKAFHALKDALSEDTEGDVPEEVVKAVQAMLGAKDAVSPGCGCCGDCAMEAKSEDDAETKAPKPYGNVRYADPEDGKYPIDTVAHIRAALAYINVQKNYDALGDHAAHVKRAIEAAARSHGIEVSDGKEFDGETFVKAIADIWLKAGATASGVGGDGALVQAIHDASSHLGAACPVIEVTDPDSGASSGANKELDQETFTKALDATLTPEESPAEAAAAADEAPAPAAAETKASKRARERELEMFRMQAMTKTQ